MSGNAHTTIGSLVTGSLGAWFVAVGELDIDPAWSFAKKMGLVILGGLVAGIAHQLGTRLATVLITRGETLVSGLGSLVAKLRRK